MADAATLKVVNTGLGNELEGVSTFYIIHAQAAINYSLRKFVHNSVMDVSDKEEREALSGLSIARQILSEVLAVRSVCGQLDDGGA